MFGKGKNTDADAAPDVELTADLLQLIATAGVAQDAKLAAARDRVATATGWSADLAAGTISFEHDAGSLTGPVQFIGSYSPDTSTWLWGWANSAMPEHVTSAVAEAAGYGLANGISALTTPKLHGVDKSLADELAAVAIHLSDAGTLYRGVTGTTVAYLAFGELA
jgi:hypothetical protein